jgi:hypothetical protein
VLAGLIGLASRSGGGQQVINILDAGAYDGDALADVGALLGGGSATEAVAGAGRSLLGTVFGNAHGSVVDVVAKAFGLKKESAGSLLALAVPLVLNFVGLLRGQQGLTSDGLARVLGEQRQFLVGIVPPGLTSLAGFGRVLDAGTVPAGESFMSPSRRGLLPGLVLAALALALLLFARGGGAP